MDWLLAQDRSLLLAINGCHSSFIDSLMVLVSERLVWIPLYLGLLLLIYKQLGWRGIIFLGISFVVVIVASDQITSGLLKPLVGRLRPCHAPELSPLLHLVDNKCGGPYGFASSHAANFFALATFVGWVLRHRYLWVSIMLFAIAVIVAYSRIYLGVHYPSDVLAGAAIGILSASLGILLFKIVSRRLNFPQNDGN